MEFFAREFVAGYVAGDFGCPVFGVGLRNSLSARALVAVPEAAVNKDGLLAADEDEVRAARQVAAVQAIAVAARVQPSADQQFDGGVFIFYRLHGSPSDFRRLHAVMTFGWG